MKESSEELKLLLTVSRILDSSEDLGQIIHPILTAIARHTPMLRGAITLLNRDTHEIMIESSFGLTESQQKRGRYQLGEGITGQVVKTGKPIIIPDAAADPGLINRTGAELQEDSPHRTAFLSVPVIIGNSTIGTLNVTCRNDTDMDLKLFLQLLSIISSMIARAVKLRQEIIEEKQRLQAENDRLLQELKERFRPANIIGTSQSMQLCFDLIGQVCRSEATVMIRGESGTGKELVAQEIHYNSYRARKPFIKVNCAALPESVIESELFGHEKGAFTGAVSERKGRFELADGGTLFLDEIGELPVAMQVKLLRVLQEQEFERVGGTRTIKVNVRLITATNRNLEKEIERGTFREDLYYRLHVFPIHIPPLRERRSDIILLCDHFIEKYNRRNHCSVKRITSAAIDLFMSYHWPGNVRELENCIERAVLLSTDEVIHSFHLPPSLQSAESSHTEFTSALQLALDDLERDLIADALKSSRGNRAKAARSLGISERIMGLRVEKYRIDTQKYK